MDLWECDCLNMLSVKTLNMLKYHHKMVEQCKNVENFTINYTLRATKAYL